MTSPNSTRGLVLARVTTKVKGSFMHPDKWVYTTSTGHKLRFSEDCLDLKQWYFFEMETHKLTQKTKLVSCEKVNTDLAERMGVAIWDLQLASSRVAQSWEALDANERAVVLKTLGCVGAGVGSIPFLWGGTEAVIGSLAGESILGVATGGLSLAFGAGLATISYLQYEELQKSLKAHTQIFKTYREHRDILARLLNRIVPLKYEGLPMLDPEFQGIVKYLHAVIDNFDASLLWNMTDENYEYAVA